MKFIVNFVSKHLNSKNSQNAIWLIGDKIIRLGIGLIVTAYITRFLGPSNYGTWNYVIAVTSMLSVFSTLGMESIIVKDLIEKKYDENEILGSAFLMRGLGGILVIILSVVWIILLDGADKILILYVLISSLSYLFFPFEVIDFYFQSLVKSKITVKSRFIALLISTLLKIWALSMKLSLVYFVGITTIEIFFSSLFMILFYTSYTKKTVFAWRFNKTFMINKIRQLLPLILSGMVIMIYMRIDQVMIKHYLDESAVGVYSAAVRVSEIWYFIPMSIVSSYFPVLLGVKDDVLKLREKQNKLYSNLFLLSIAASVFLCFFSDFIISFLFGKAYHEASQILKINSWTGVFVSLGVASNSYLSARNMLNVQFYRTLTGVFANVLLNIILIPKMGVSGAAYATLISYAISGYFASWFFKDSREIFYDMTKSCSIYLFKKKWLL